MSSPKTQTSRSRASPDKSNPKNNPKLRQTSVAGLIRLIRRKLEKQQEWQSEGECVFVPAMLGGPLVSCLSPSAYVSTSVSCLAVHLWLRPADRGKPGAPVTAGSLNPSLPRLPFALLLYPSLADAGRGRGKLLSPGCCSFTLSSARALTLTVHPSLLGSPPPIRSPSLSLSPSLALSLGC